MTYLENLPVWNCSVQANLSGKYKFLTGIKNQTLLLSRSKSITKFNTFSRMTGLLWNTIVIQYLQYLRYHLWPYECFFHSRSLGLCHWLRCFSALATCLVSLRDHSLQSFRHMAKPSNLKATFLTYHANQMSSWMIPRECFKVRKWASTIQRNNRYSPERYHELVSSRC